MDSTSLEAIPYCLATVETSELDSGEGHHASELFSIETLAEPGHASVDSLRLCSVTGADVSLPTRRAERDPTNLFCAGRECLDDTPVLEGGRGDTCPMSP